MITKITYYLNSFFCLFTSLSLVWLLTLSVVFTLPFPAGSLKEFAKLLGNVEDERERMVSICRTIFLAFNLFTLYINPCLLLLLVFCLPLQIANVSDVLITPLEKFRKEQIGAAKVPSPLQTSTVLLSFVRIKIPRQFVILRGFLKVYFQ